MFKIPKEVWRDIMLAIYNVGPRPTYSGMAVVLRNMSKGQSAKWVEQNMRLYEIFARTPGQNIEVREDGVYVPY